MSGLERAALPVLQQFDPETAHRLAIGALKLGLGPELAEPAGPRLATEVAGLSLPNPIGLAAGFDKDGEAIPGLLNAGFGFVEIGTVTPLPQPGNAKPRLHRLPTEQAVINRLGFNSAGADIVARRLARRPWDAVVGVNLGANAKSEDRIGDYVSVLQTCGPQAEFVTLNISSPNTENLRDLQAAEALRELLDRTLTAREALTRRIPVFVKLAPDLDDAELDAIAKVLRSAGVDGVVATNTTISREGLKRRTHRKGGLSGQPLFERSTKLVAGLYQRLDGQLPIIGVGGVSTADQALEKIRAGASAVQLYTALVYGGVGLVATLRKGLDKALDKAGFETVADAVGTGVADWA